MNFGGSFFANSIQFGNDKVLKASWLDTLLGPMIALQLMKGRLDVEFAPDGYNIGANCGKVAGQSVMHLHLHLMPRYQGDMENPKGGVRGVIPSKQKY